jgi:tellurium resistance protein TerD
MAIVLEKVKKGQGVDLRKKDPSLKQVKVALGWDTQKYDGREPFDLDVSVFMLQDNKLVRDERDFIFYGNLQHETGAVIHSGDEREGSKDGDDEVITVYLDKIPEHVTELAFVVTIYEAKERKQNFGQVQNAYVRIDNGETNVQLYQYDLTEDYDIQTAVEVCKIYKHNGVWKFKAIGEGYEKGLDAFVRQYGLEVK